MELLVIAIAVLLIEALSARYGRDSRDGRDWSSRPLP